MPGLLSDIDPDGLLEFSVVFTDRSVNHMSQKFQHVMNDISSTLKRVYDAEAVAVVPGGGTYGMEAVARQFANDKKCLVIRNGFFSFRWSQILDMGNIPASTTVLGSSSTTHDIDNPIEYMGSSVSWSRTGSAGHARAARGRDRQERP